MSLTLSSLSWKMKIKLHLRISAVHMITIVCFNLTALLMRLFTNPDCMQSRRDSTNNWKGLERILIVVLRHYFYTLDTMVYQEGRCSGSSRRTATMPWWQTVSDEMMWMQFCSAFILEITVFSMMMPISRSAQFLKIWTRLGSGSSLELPQGLTAWKRLWCPTTADIAVNSSSEENQYDLDAR